MDLACHYEGQPIGGDQEYGHSTEIWGLGWSNPRQDYSMNHGRVGHSCNGLIHQVYVHPVSQMYFIPFGGCPCRRIATTSCILVWECCQMRLISFILGDARGQASSLSTDLPGDMEVCE